MRCPSRWFAFPTQPDAVRELAEAHVGKTVIGLSTPLPESPGISLVQVLTFVDPVLGYRHYFPEKTCAQFNALALAVHAGLAPAEQADLALLVKSAGTVAASVFGAGPDELFVLVPTRVAPLVREQIEGVLQDPDAIASPFPDSPLMRDGPEPQ